MADPLPYPDSKSDTDDATDVRPDRRSTTRRSTTRTPRWVYVFAIIAIVLVLLLVVQILMGGNHGPGRHTLSGDAGGQTPSEVYVSSVARPMPVSPAICDLVTDASPCSATSAAPSRMKTLTTTRDRGDAQ